MSCTASRQTRMRRLLRAVQNSGTSDGAVPSRTATARRNMNCVTSRNGTSSLRRDRMPADVFELVARCGVSEYGVAVGEEKTGVEASEDRGRGDRPSDISQYVDRRADTALRIGRLDRAEAVQVLGRGGRRPGAPADQHADLLPGLAQRGAGAAGEARRKMSARRSRPARAFCLPDRLRRREIPRHPA